MLFKVIKWQTLFLFVSFCLVFPAMSQIYNTSVPDPLKRKASMNKDWQFFKGTPTGTPQNTNYNDSGTGWSTVVIPHSCSYDSAPVVVTGPANWVSEWNYYKGIAWYRKIFGVPASTKKLLIEFEGAMQVATVYINGSLVGIHGTSGYTPFVFDITPYIVRGTDNVLAVKLDNTINNDIPPGTTYTSQTNGRPDFLLFSGLYRNVWLHAKDSVYIPIYSQQISTKNVSAASAQIRALTPIKNDRPSAQSVSLTVTLLNATQATVGTPMTLTQTIAAHALDTFDMTSAAISNPNLWSPTNPYMYSVKTIVSVGGVVVDSAVEPCGFRYFTWAQGASGHLMLNGSGLEIRGMCSHQFQGWMENAVPDSRMWQEIKLMKAMGCNSIRCSHYPRAQSFYDMCDKIGMLVYVEIPTWGWGYTPSTLCWARMDSCVKEMVLSGRNHPCIYLWGLYNEPKTNGDFAADMSVLNNTAHFYDSTRFTAESNINGFNTACVVPDVQGLNYTATGTAGAYRWLGTESRQGFYWASYRGSPIDLDTTDVSSNGNAYMEWLTMAYTMTTNDQLSGMHFWCFKDYNTPCNTNGNEGVVDRFTVPKTIYYMFRKYWTGQAPEYPRSGTATTIQLLTDTNSLHANGVDVFLITATMRNAAGYQIATATGNVTFTVTPANAATFFGGNVVPSYAGRAGAFLRTTTVPGTITVTAAYAGLTTQSVTLNTVRDTNYVPPFGPGVSIGSKGVIFAPSYKFNITSVTKGFVFQCPDQIPGNLRIINCQGKTMYASSVNKGASLFISRKQLGAGIFYASWKGVDQRVVSHKMIVE